MNLQPQPLSEERALSRLMALCARGEHSSGDVRTKMRLWKLDAQAQERILQRLIDGRFVDDERFARAFVADKLKYNHWGRRKIEQGLWAKGISPEVQERALAEVQERDYLSVLVPLLQQKSRQLGPLPEAERQLKLMRFAASRGFTPDETNKALAE